MTENIVLERLSESTITFVADAREAYLGYVTIKVLIEFHFRFPFQLSYIRACFVIVLWFYVLQFTPDITSSVPHHKHYCLEVTENCSPTVDHCSIRSSSVGMFRFDSPYITWWFCMYHYKYYCMLILVGAAVCVNGWGAEPTIKNCDITDCENVGLFVTDGARVSLEFGHDSVRILWN